MQYSAVITVQISTIGVYVVNKSTVSMYSVKSRKKSEYQAIVLDIVKFIIVLLYITLQYSTV